MTGGSTGPASRGAENPIEAAASPSPAFAVSGGGDQTTGRSPFWLTTAAAAGLITVVMVARNWLLLHSNVTPGGDAAADMLLIDRANRDWLLTGHYSRFGFHHPGPFFLYVRHLAEKLAGGHLESPFAAQELGVFATSALFAGMAVAALAGLGSRRAAGPVIAMAALAAVLAQADGTPTLTSLWMPDVIVAPFFAFVLLLAETARGRLRLLPPATFCGVALVHGYAPLVPFVGIAWPLALALGLWRLRRQDRGAALPIRALAISIGIIVLFAAPLAFDAWLHPPGNVAQIVAAARVAQPQDARSLSVVLGFVASQWAAVNPLLWPAAAIGCALAWRNSEARTAQLHVAGVVVLMTLLMAPFARYAPDRLYPFIGNFYLGAPLALATTGIAAGVAALSSRSLGLVAAGAAAALVATASFGDFTARPRSLRAEIPTLVEAIAKDLAAHGDRGARLSFTPGSWPLAAGLLVELLRRGDPACATVEPLAFLFTPERICPRRPDARQFEIIAAAACDGRCIVEAAGTGIMATPPAASGGILIPR